MNSQKRGGGRMRTLYDLQKRWLAFLLAAAMVLTNAGTGINTVYAADSAETVAFTMDGTKLLNAVRESIIRCLSVTLILPMERLQNSKACFSEREN